MMAYSMHLDPKAQFSYATMEYGHFEVREVMIGDRPKGEWHIKLLDKSSVDKAVAFFKREIPDAEVGAVDSSGLLNLEYPIYILTNDTMVMEAMVSYFEEIDAKLKAFREKSGDNHR